MANDNLKKYIIKLADKISLEGFFLINEFMKIDSLEETYNIIASAYTSAMLNMLSIVSKTHEDETTYNSIKEFKIELLEILERYYNLTEFELSEVKYTNLH